MIRVKLISKRQSVRLNVYLVIAGFERVVRTKRWQFDTSVQVNFLLLS